MLIAHIFRILLNIISTMIYSTGQYRVYKYRITAVFPCRLLDLQLQTGICSFSSRLLVDVYVGICVRSF